MIQLQLALENAAEVSPASDWCQRWRDGRHHWRHRTEGGFDSRRYEVAALGERTARAFVEANHYSGSYPAARLRYGIYRAGNLQGVAVLSVPVQRAVLARPFPHLEPYYESLELGRFVLADEVPANGESWFLARVFELAAREGIRGVVSFADPVPRLDLQGRVVFPGHIGTIYQAVNACYTGRANPRTLLLLPDGTVLSERALAKVRAQDRGHEYVERRLRTFGAGPRRTGEPADGWLRRALVEAGVRRLRHGGCHRYAFRLGNRSVRRSVMVGLQADRYPKLLHPCLSSTQDSITAHWSSNATAVETFS